jgi:hypothetical protein
VADQIPVAMSIYEADELPSHPYGGTVGSLDLAVLESEDKLGCARGIVWAIIFEAALAAAAVVCWKLHFWPR